ncbi:MAG: histidine kinase N-terminal 7TM domain-containing protein [Anaerolineae bacterium]
MNFDFNNIVIALFSIAALTGGVSLIAWQRRYLGRWAKIFSLLMVAVSIWSFGYGLEIGASSLAWKIVWAKFQYLGIQLTPMSWFLFAILYSGNTRLYTSLRAKLLLIVPAITFGLVLTNEFHHLIWQTIEIDTAGYFHPLIVTYGAWFWVAATYSYLLMFGGSLAIFIAFIRQNEAYRWQNGIILLCALTPWFGNAVYILGFNTLGKLDLSPFGLGITGALLYIGIFQNRLFDLVPVARRVVVENMKEGIIILDVNQRIVDMNPAAKKILNLNLKNLIGNQISQIPIIESKLQDFNGDHNNTLITEIEINHQPETKYYELHVSSILNDGSELNGQLVSILDITQRKEAERAQQQRTKTLETLNSLSRDITSSLDLNMILDTVVESASKLLNVTSAYVSDYDLEKGTIKVIAEYMSPDASALEQESDLNVVYDLEDDYGVSIDWINDPNNKFVSHFDDPNTPEEERAHMAKYGCKTAVEVPLYANGELIGALELWESRHKREFSSDEITLILAIAQQAALALYNATLYEKALSAIQFKSRLIAQVNHELRTPLSVILLYSEMLEAGVFGTLSSDQSSTVGKLVLNTNYLHSLVEQLLAQAEFENGKVDLRKDEFNPTELVRQVQDQLKILAENKGLALTSETSPMVPKVLTGDREKIFQVLVNLITNAIKYTKEGSVHVSLFQPEAGLWSFQISDTGIGIPEASHTEIFEPFWQASEVTTKESKNGAGLGLSIVKQLVNVMDGQISVESEVGLGSKFTVTLPYEPCKMLVQEPV